MSIGRSFMVLALAIAVLGPAPQEASAAHPHGDNAHNFFFDSRDGGWLGVTLQELDDDLRESLDLDRRVEGALVIDVASDSPAEKAGIKAHDVIVEVDGKRVRDVDQAIEIIGDNDPGDKVRIAVNRGGQEHHLQAELGDQQDRAFAMGHSPQHAPWAPRAPRSHNRMFWSDEHDGRVIVLDDEDGETHVIPLKELEDGSHEMYGHNIDVQREGKDGDERVEVVIRNEKNDGKQRIVITDDDGRDVRVHHRRNRGLDDEVMFFDDDYAFSRGAYLGVSTTTVSKQLREYFGVGDSGVLVSMVVTDSPADKAGLKAGDIIRAVGEERIDSPSDLRRVIRRRDPGEEVQLFITRDRKEKTITLKLADSSDFGGLPASGFPEQVAKLHERLDLDQLHEELRELHENIDMEDFHESMEDLHEELQELHLNDMKFEFETEAFEELQEDLQRQMERLHLNREHMERAREAMEQALRQHRRQI